MSGRTSFELPYFLWDLLEKEAKIKGWNKVQVLREIIDATPVDASRLHRSIVDFLRGEDYINRLQEIADQSIPQICFKPKDEPDDF
ncbi:hypothetical protein MTBBW1_2130041 [Desulfamplus magnetovallimortis]|uniref:Ribbon-helix-helix domain-containing protein n=1 Tax=Desulfamplus magnetovallimortis TaxID=1246637 RepID=A0A1W1HCI7_9BACT|nr:hypothetical protein [Desulfamplus magnetovallimortis]SLM30146.1 hypothetical protein MTBBW1_2130041 [Desulfamplus magnetovallimortis]